MVYRPARNKIYKLGENRIIMDSKVGKATVTVGMFVRLIAVFIIAVSMPFLVTRPDNIVAIIAFAFGNFVMVLGGLLQ